MFEELTLLPCPACGYNAYLKEERSSFGIKAYSVCCRRCELITGLSRTKEQAIAGWNALPRTLGWTIDPPKVPGWYWFKDEYGIRIAWIKHDSRKMNELYAVIGGVGNWMSTLHGQWAGPIPEPREPKE